MRVLVTGSAGYLGERICQHLEDEAFEVIGFDQAASEYTNVVGDIQDHDLLIQALQGVEVAVHVAGYHRPYLHHQIVTEQQLIETNIVGTLNLLESAAKVGVKNLVFTSTTAVYGDSRKSAHLSDGTQAATIISEETLPRPRGPYGMSKLAAERLCEVYHNRKNLNVIILRPSRFFPDQDVDESLETLSSHNLKANELLHRRVDVRDLVAVYSLAVRAVERLQFDLFLISAATPLLDCDPRALMTDAPGVVEAFFPGCTAVYTAREWSMAKTIEFVYSSSKVRKFLGYQSDHDFKYHLDKEFEELSVDNESPPWRRRLTARESAV
jgi:UDP-glucose 4-epimerase